MQKALLTHWHPDHVGGISDLKRLCPQVIIHKNEPENGQEVIEDGQVFSVEGATLKAFHTPGHAFDHMAFVLEEEDAFFTGDSEWARSFLLFFTGLQCSHQQMSWAMVQVFLRT